MNLDDNVIDVFIDGGSRGNPGMAACAFVVYVNNLQFYQESKYLGVATNNEAEYQGLLMALGYLEKLNLSNFSRINLNMDSELVVKQVKGEYKVKNQRLKILYDKTLNMIKKLGLKISILCVPRSENFVADKLVNERLDSAN
ncbi:MAG: ribonuclease HI family protein [Patescibacteria group bacterium]|nr:ribonuclease HI family protein [Patescibacteria group bacterium]